VAVAATELPRVSSIAHTPVDPSVRTVACVAPCRCSDARPLHVGPATRRSPRRGAAIFRFTRPDLPS
jgi:hypothetical protein